MVDDCHATGVLGEHGRGSAEYHHLMGKIDIITSTLGKALGGASGGFTAAKQPIIDILRQKITSLFIFKYVSTCYCKSTLQR